MSLSVLLPPKNCIKPLYYTIYMKNRVLLNFEGVEMLIMSKLFNNMIPYIKTKDLMYHMCKSKNFFNPPLWRVSTLNQLLFHISKFLMLIRNLLSKTNKMRYYTWWSKTFFSFTPFKVFTPFQRKIEIKMSFLLILMMSSIWKI